MSKIDKKGGFSLKKANIDSKYDSFIHFTIKFNSEDYLISIFSGIINSKIYSTRSVAALRAADLDWIVGPGYSLGGTFWRKTMKTNLKP